MENQLTKVAEETGLDKTKSETILSNFTNLFDKAKEYEIKAKEIVVKDETDIASMKLAREARLVLKDIRVNAEKVRKDLKEQSLREGKAIDGIANVIKALIVPIEEYLEDQEKFAEKKEKEKREALTLERVTLLTPYVEDVSLFNLEEMSEAGFKQLLQSSKGAVEAQKVAEKKAEDERIEKEKADKKERERIDAENAKLKLDAEAKEKQEKIDKDAREKKEKETQAKHDAELKVVEDAKLKLEADAKKKEQDEAKAREEKQAEEDRIKKETEDAKKKAELAPDRDKIFAFSNAIANVDIPICSSLEAKRIIEQAEDEIRIACKKMCSAIDKV